MLNVASECINYTPINKSSYTLADFAEELIRILPGSPLAFTKMLSLALSGRFGTDIDDVYSMINYIAETVGKLELEKAFQHTSSEKGLTLSQTPVISDAVMPFLDDTGMQLAILLSRHVYADLSETDAGTAAISKQALLTGTGTFTTSYAVGCNRVRIKTDMTTRVANIDLA